MFEDPPKHSAAEAIARLEALSVRVKIISGDTPLVVRHLVETLGLPRRDLLTGAEIDELNELALGTRVHEVDLFARVTPDQKVRIIRALQAGGHTVGFMGDGINDAPAIRTADVGVSVDDATDIARAAADIVLLDSDLGVLADGVHEGRRTYANIMKYVRMGTSSNFGNMLSMALSSIIIPFLPLTPVQVLLNNLLYDTSETGIPFDRVEPQEVAEPHAWDMASVLRFTLVMGPLSSLFDIAIFAILLLGFGADPATFRTAWFVEIDHDADSGDLHHSDRTARIDQPAASVSDCHVARCACGRMGFHADSPGSRNRLCSLVLAADRVDRRSRRRLSDRRRGRQRLCHAGLCRKIC